MKEMSDLKTLITRGRRSHGFISKFNNKQTFEFDKKPSLYNLNQFGCIVGLTIRVFDLAFPKVTEQM